VGANAQGHCEKETEGNAFRNLLSVALALALSCIPGLVTVVCDFIVPTSQVLRS
jgi:hypothetical protein